MNPQETFLASRLSSGVRFPFRVTVLESGCVVPVSHKQRDKHGYGIVERSVLGKEKRVRLHRLAYEQYNGGIPENEIVRHTCDNPPCINPQHLKAGTHADNVRDKVERNRQARGEVVSRRGEENGRSKLNAEQVVELRNLWHSGLYTRRMLSRFFNITAKYTREITIRRRWAHL